MNNLYCTTKDQADRVVRSKHWSVLAFDTETYDKKLGLGVVNKDGATWWNSHPHIVTICDGTTAVMFDIHKDPSIIESLKELFNKTVMVLGHNIIYDAKILRKIDIDVFDKVWYDTMVGEHLLDEEKRLGLKDLVKEYYEVELPPYKEAIKHGPHSKEFYDYALNDAIYTWKLFQSQKGRLQDEGLTTLARELEGPFLKVIAEMEMNGFLVDTGKLSQIVRTICEDLPELELKCLQLLKVPHSFQANLFGDLKIVTDFNFNLNSSTQLAQQFMSVGVALKDKTPTGKYAVGTPNLSKVKEQHESVPAVMKYKNVHKLKTAFFEPLPKLLDPDSRVRSHFNNCGTVTGRLSSSRPNLQQLSGKKKDKYGLRTCFVAPKGKKLVTCDYSGQELRILAHISRDENMIDAFRKGKDLHLAMANQFFNLGIPDEELFESHPKLEEHKVTYKAERDKAKIINFGIAYGKGPQGFAEDFNLPLDEATKILDMYFEAAPGVKRAIDHTRLTVQKQGYVATMTGRKRRFKKVGGEYYTNSSFRQAFNFLIQGFASDMLRMASVKVYKLSKLYPEWELKAAATVHDENVYEVKEEYVEEAKIEIKKCFESILEGFRVPIVAEVGVGDDYGTAK